MPSLSLNIGLNNGRKLPFGGFDADASAYFTTAGVTDATAKKQINDFVVGIKGLGFYNSIVCWPLRSAQNAGTGTTAYSLGGLGTYNSTLTNGPTWGTDGINLDGVNDFIQTSYAPSNGSFSAGFVAKNLDIERSNSIVYSVDNTFSGNRKLNLYWTTLASQKLRFEANLAGSMATRIDVNNTATSDFLFAQTSHDGTTFYGQANANTIQTASGIGSCLGAGDSITLGRRSSDAAATPLYGVISFAYIIQSSINSNFTNLYTLYKTTLGTGLGLP